MPNLEKLRSMLEKQPGDAFLLYAIAQQLAKQGDHEAAIASYDHAIKADPTNGYHHFHKARSLMELDRTGEAAQTLREGIESANAAGDSKALAELRSYLDEIE